LTTEIRVIYSFDLFYLKFYYHLYYHFFVWFGFCLFCWFFIVFFLNKNLFFVDFCFVFFVVVVIFLISIDLIQSAPIDC